MNGLMNCFLLRETIQCFIPWAAIRTRVSMWSVLLTLCMLGNFAWFFLSSADFFQYKLFKNFSQKYHQSVKQS